jgi:hypothetical protein
MNSEGTATAVNWPAYEQYGRAITNPGPWSASRTLISRTPASKAGGIGEAGAAGPLGCALLATHAAFLPPSGGGLSEVSLLGLPCRSTVVTTCAVLDTAAPD